MFKQGETPGGMIPQPYLEVVVLNKKIVKIGDHQSKIQLWVRLPWCRSIHPKQNVRENVLNWMFMSRVLVHTQKYLNITN